MIRQDRHLHHRFRHPPLLHMFSYIFFFTCVILAGGHFLLGHHYKIEPPSSPVPSTTASSHLWEMEDWEHRVCASASSSSPNLTVLVTGAAGFLGTHVSLSLRHRGDCVIGLDSFDSARYSPVLKRSRQSLLSDAGVVIVEGDITNSTLLNKLFSRVPFTHVLHLAASTSPRRPAFADDIGGLVALLEATKATVHHPPAFVWGSSTAVYGLNPTSIPAVESDQTDRPITFAAAAKKSGEEVTHIYNHIYGISITTLRLSTVYGPWGRPDHPYFTLTRKILRKIPLSVESSLDMAYIDEVVNASIAAVDTAGKSNCTDGKKQGPAPMRVYNIASGSLVPVWKVVDILELLLKTKAERKVRRSRAEVVVDISLARRELGFQPTTNLKTGLMRFIKWYMDYYKRSPRMRTELLMMI